MANTKRTFTDKEEQLIKEYALNNCLTNTIAVALDIPLMTLKRRYGKKLRHWRAQGKVELRKHQVKLAEHNPAMAMFLGKQARWLGQVDKQVITDERVELKRLDDKEKIEAREYADWYRTHNKGHKTA